ncbi:hypothetical protein X798_07936 [Onchocerca flexuosa]|uniref:Uncharacterized protein n=2 Tax=Onchocerca flexuosa TaxID=387005 RepID=A0A183H1C8_9BILA|nr:hypothetical protein X798_07936 [Onchocerca flexuosa]VDO28985.1 unnamed protein product [Onchocerca flexuosa]
MFCSFDRLQEINNGNCGGNSSITSSFHTVPHENRIFLIAMSVCVRISPTGNGMLFSDCHKIVIQLAVVNASGKEKKKEFRFSDAS